MTADTQKTAEEWAERIDLSLVRWSPNHEASDNARSFLATLVEEIILAERERLREFLDDAHSEAEECGVEGRCAACKMFGYLESRLK